MKAAYLVLIFTCLGCTKIPGNSIDPSFQSYYNNFLVDAAAAGRAVDTQDLTIRFGAEDSDVNGTCQISTMSGLSGLQGRISWKEKVITISQSSWQYWDDLDKKTVIYHELGHCTLGIYSHTNTTQVFPDGQTLPTSIMNAYDIYEMSPFETNKYWNSYLSQLFTNSLNFSATVSAVQVSTRAEIITPVEHNSATEVRLEGHLEFE